MKGFTLLEVLLSLAIFSMIGISTVKQIRQIRATKDAAFEGLDQFDGLRTAISLIRSDLSQSFHISIDDLGEEKRAALLQNQAVPHTLFDGRKNELIFTSLSHRVYQEGKHETKQAEISYFLKVEEGTNLRTLVKRETGFIDDDPYQGGSLYTILPHVSKLEFQYWDRKRAQWLDEWNSDGNLQRDRFPPAVKIRMTVAKNEKELAVETTFKIDFPNNEAYAAEF